MRDPEFPPRRRAPVHGAATASTAIRKLEEELGATLFDRLALAREMMPELTQ